jgi:hypothetical protein
MKPFKNMSRRAKVIDGVIILLLVLVVVYVGYVFAFNPTVSQDWEFKFGQAIGIFGIGSTQLDHVLFLEAPQSGGKIYGGLFGPNLSDLHLSTQDTVVDFARQGNDIPVVVHRVDKGTYEVNLNGTILATSPDEIQSIAISPDSSLVAYAEASSVGSTADPKNWTVVLASSKNGKVRIKVQAFEVAFLDNKTLLVFTPAGVGSVDINTGTLSMNLVNTFVTSSVQFALSSDRSMFAWNQAGSSGGTKVMKVVSISPLQLTQVPLAALYGYVNGSLALSDTELYALSGFSTTTTSSTLVEIPLVSGAESHATFFKFPVGVFMNNLVL